MVIFCHLIAGLLRMRCRLQLATANLSAAASSRILLVGPQRSIEFFKRHVNNNKDLGLEVAAVCHTDKSGIGDPRGGVDINNLPLACTFHQINQVMVCTGLGDRALVEKVVSNLIATPVSVQWVPDFEALPVFCMHASELAGQPILQLTGNPMPAFAIAMKWLEDRVLGTVMLICFAPLMAIIAVLIKLTSPARCFLFKSATGLVIKSSRCSNFAVCARSWKIP